MKIKYLRIIYLRKRRMTQATNAIANCSCFKNRGRIALGKMKDTNRGTIYLQVGKELADRRLA